MVSTFTLVLYTVWSHGNKVEQKHNPFFVLSTMEVKHAHGQRFFSMVKNGDVIFLVPEK